VTDRIDLGPECRLVALDGEQAAGPGSEIEVLEDQELGRCHGWTRMI
jgi:hypothetical protein